MNNDFPLSIAFTNKTDKGLYLESRLKAKKKERKIETQRFGRKGVVFFFSVSQVSGLKTNVNIR